MISTCKSQLYFYTPAMNQQSWKEMKKTVPLTVASEIIKYTEKFKKEMEDLCSEICKTSLQKTKEYFLKMERYNAFMDQKT